MSRNTGGVLEAMVMPALEHGGYLLEKQVTIGTRCGGGVHKVDAIATKAGRRTLVSLKWQQTGGTAEQKVPFEISLLEKLGSHSRQTLLAIFPRHQSDLDFRLHGTAQ